MLHSMFFIFYTMNAIYFMVLNIFHEPFHQNLNINVCYIKCGLYPRSIKLG